MGRNGRWLLAALALAAPAVADDALVERWDKPRRESFDLKDTWPKNVAEELAKRYGVPFDLDAAVGVDRIDFTAKDVTFFEALDRFAAANGIHLTGVPGPEEQRPSWETDLKLVRADPPLPRTPVAYFGPSRFSVECVSVTTVGRCAPGLKGPDQPCLRIRLKWIVEPGLENAALLGWTCTHAVDDRGSACAPLAETDDFPLDANNRFFTVLEPPRRGAKAIARLEATVRIALPLERGETAFEASETGKTKKLGGARVTLVGVDGTRVRFSLEGAANPELGTTDVCAQILDGARDIDDATLSAYDESGAEIDGGVMLTLGGDLKYAEFASPPKRLVFRAITRVAVREANVAFTDIPLPE